MSSSQFIQNKLAESGATTILQVVRTVNSMITQLTNIFTSLSSQAQLSSILLTNIQLQTGNNQIPHTLGKTLTGWQLVRLKGNVQVWDAQDTQSNPTQYLTLFASAPVVVSILCF